MATFVQDAFTDTNGTLLQDHTPDTGGAWAELDFKANETGSSTVNADISSNRVVAVSTTASRGYRNAADPGSNEYDITGDINRGIQTIEGIYTLLGRMTPTGTSNSAVDRYHVEHRTGSGFGSRLKKTVSGTQTELDSDSTTMPSGTHTMKLEIRDAAKKYFFDDTETLTSTDDVITQDGRAGVGGANEVFAGGNYMDNYLAATVAAPPAGIASMRQLIGVGQGTR